MRRVLISAVVIACAGVAMAALASSRAASNYRVDAIFDTAQGIVAGQVVKVAGAQVGTVQSVRLTVGPKARMALAIDRRFACTSFRPSGTGNFEASPKRTCRGW